MMGNEKVGYGKVCVWFRSKSQPFGRGRYWKNYGMCWKKTTL